MLSSYIYIYICIMVFCFFVFVFTIHIMFLFMHSSHHVYACSTFQMLLQQLSMISIFQQFWSFRLVIIEKWIYTSKIGCSKKLITTKKFIEAKHSQQQGKKWYGPTRCAFTTFFNATSPYKKLNDIKQQLFEYIMLYIRRV